jgi:hypothetical protein
VIYSHAVLVPKLPLAAAALVAGLTAVLGERVLVPRLGDAIAGSLLRATAILPAGPAEETADSERGPSRTLADRAAAGEQRAREEPLHRSRPTGGAIDVPADLVARLTARQLRGIGASDAVDGAGQGLGARLHGVSALGSGLGDGDVVTSIDGRAVRSASEATAAAFAAYASGESVVRGTVLREGRVLHVTVHIPAHTRH